MNRICTKNIFFNFRTIDHHIVEVDVLCFNSFSMTGKCYPSKSGLLHYQKLERMVLVFWNITYKIYLEPFKLLVWCPFDGPDTKTAQITIEYVHRRQVVGRRPVYVFTKFYYRLFIDELIKCYWRPKLKFSPNSNIFSRYKVETFLTK